MANPLDENAGSASRADFANFMRQRSELNSKLEDAKRDIDNWFERQPIPAPLNALAQLEVLLVTRRNLLEELVRLDDAFVIHLVQLRRTG